MQPALADDTHSMSGCNPCTFEIAKGIQPYVFTLEVKPVGDRVTIERILVSSKNSSNALQVLKPHNMEPSILAAVPFLLKADTDINHDGYKDIFFVTSGVSPQVGGDYWIFDPKNNQFAYSGSYPELFVDNANNEITSIVNSGYNLQYKNFYGFHNGKLEKTKYMEKENISSTEDLVITRIKTGKLWKVTDKTRMPATRW